MGGKEKSKIKNSNNVFIFLKPLVIKAAKAYCDKNKNFEFIKNTSQSALFSSTYTKKKKTKKTHHRKLQ